ncbi:hypothetical protein INF35_00745 [Subdoligranulum sp. DSM 109015]|uniref:Uncharacterized protein n=1 Tax=Gemmiger gallinarum TaxID=2779354 RepID=A0ABR9QZM6_9FIRM|nr:hypothetical protein [Gemmiger gallinarum]MBE5036334.1 hypothetical protein [Gemmiger gallinarum]
MGMDWEIPARKAVEQNLLDAGCDCEKTQQYLRLLEEGRMQELIQMLRCQRCHLMEKLHREQQKVDCLDYLIYQLKKGNCDRQG